MVLALIVYGLLTHWWGPKLDRETRCRKCGYILRGISEPRCSECGEPFDLLAQPISVQVWEVFQAIEEPFQELVGTVDYL